MMTQKMVIALMIVCLAVFIASLLKFAERTRLSFSIVKDSLFMPIFLSMFMVYFFIYTYKKDFCLLEFPQKVIQVYRFILLEIQITPIIHTTIIDAICCLQKVPDSKFKFFRLKRSAPVRVVVENLHGRFSLANNLA